MKLYTEQQVRQAYIDGMDFIAVDPTMYEQDADEYMRDVHSIELPSNDEIEKWAHSKYHEVEDSRWFEPLQVGAKWMRDKLIPKPNETEQY